MKIYLVCGTDGQYSDRSDWNVKAFAKKELADELVAKLTSVAKPLEVGYLNFSGDARKKVEAELRELDPGVGDLGWDEPAWSVEEIELVE